MKQVNPQTHSASAAGSINFDENAQVGGDLVSSNKSVVQTGGGNYYGGDVYSGGGKFVGRDESVPIDANEQPEPFTLLHRQVNARENTDPPDRDDLHAELKAMQAELMAGDATDESLVLRHLRYIGRIAPDILQSAMALIASPDNRFPSPALKAVERMKMSSTAR